MADITKVPAEKIIDAYGTQPHIQGHSKQNLAINSVGKMYLTYQDDVLGLSSQQIKLFSSSDGGETWIDENFPEGNSGYNKSYPSLAIDSNDIVHVVFESFGGTHATKEQIYYVSFDGNTFTEHGRINPNAEYQRFSSIAIDSNDIIHVVFCGATGGLFDKVEYTNYNGVSWSSALDITTADSSSNNDSIIEVDSSDNLHVIWRSLDSGSGGYTRIKYNRFNGASWGTWQNIYNSSLNQISGHLMLDSTGKVHVVFEIRLGGADNVYYVSGNYGSWNAPITITAGGGVAESRKPVITRKTDDTFYILYDNEFGGGFDTRISGVYNNGSSFEAQFDVIATGGKDYQNAVPIRNLTDYTDPVLVFEDIANKEVWLYGTASLTSPPDAPIVTGQILTNKVRPTWSWNSVPDATKYRISFDDVIYFDHLGTSYTPSIDFPYGVHTIYVKASNNGLESLTAGTFTTTIKKGGLTDMRKISFGVPVTEWTSDLTGIKTIIELSKEATTVLGITEEVVEHYAEQTGNVPVQANVKTVAMQVTQTAYLDSLILAGLVNQEQVDYSDDKIYYGLADKNGCNANTGKLVLTPRCDGLLITDNKFTIMKAYVKIDNQITYGVDGEALVNITWVAMAVKTDLPTPVTPVGTGGTSGTLADGSYIYKVGALNLTGESIGSSASNSVTLSGGGNGNIVVAFTQSVGAQAYKIYRSDDAGSTWESYTLTQTDIDNGQIDDDGTLTFATDTPLSSATGYYYPMYQRGGTVA